MKPVAIMPQATGAKSTDRPATTAKPATRKSLDRPGLAAAQPAKKPPAPDAKATPKKAVDKPQLATAKPVTKRVQVAKTDPLAALVATAKAKDPATAR